MPVTKPAPHERVGTVLSTDGVDVVGQVNLGGHKYDKIVPPHLKHRGVNPFKRTFDGSPF